MSANPLRRIEGKYEILAKLKEGGMGAIYKVRHRLLDEVRVVKLMRPQLTEIEDLKERFVREARFAIRLRHPNIAQLYDFTIDEEDDTAFIVMEFIDGINLAEVLATSGPPPLSLTLEIAHQSLRALGYLHEKGFIHRDISPDNLILTTGTDGEPLVKLIDLGIAKTVGAGSEGLTQTGMFLGKVRYASPEQFGAGGAAHVDNRGDLYSLGIVLYELLTGLYPIQGRDPSSIIAGHLFRGPIDFAESDPQERVPPRLREIILQALAKQPAERFATALDFSRALTPFLQLGDRDELSLARILNRRSGDHESSLRPVGSTQERLNEQFVLGTTPSRGGHPAPTPAQPLGPVIPALRESTAAIEWNFQHNNVPAAEDQSRRALTFGEQPEPHTLRDRLEGLRIHKAEVEAESLIAQSQQLLEMADFKGALESLDRAQELDPGNPEVTALRAEVKAAIEQQAQRERQEAEARQQAERIAREAASISALLARGDLDAAAARLAKSAAEPGTGPVFDDLRQRLADLHRQAQQDRQKDAERHLAASRDLIARRSFSAALRELHQAAELTPESSIVRDLILAAEVEQRTVQLAETVSRVSAILDRGELDSAEALLDEAMARYGPAESLTEQWRRLEEERHTEEKRRAAVAAENEFRGSTGTVQFEREELAAPPSSVTPEFLQVASAEPSFGHLELGAEERHSAPASTPAPTSSAPQKPPKSNFTRSENSPYRLINWRHPFWVALASGCLLSALGLGLWLFVFRHPAPRAGVTPGFAHTPPATAVAPVATGTLILDAMPWGEVIEVVDQQGAPQPLGPQRFTPLVLSLAPGQYRVTLRHPTFRQPVVVTTEIFAGVAVKSVAELGRIDEEEFFRDMGW